MLHCPVCSVKKQKRNEKKFCEMQKKNDMIKKIRQQEG